MAFPRLPWLFILASLILLSHFTNAATSASPTSSASAPKSSSPTRTGSISASRAPPSVTKSTSLSRTSSISYSSSVAASSSATASISDSISVSSTSNPSSSETPTLSVTSSISVSVTPTVSSSFVPNNEWSTSGSGTIGVAVGVSVGAALLAAGLAFFLIRRKRIPSAAKKPVNVRAAKLPVDTNPTKNPTGDDSQSVSSVRAHVPDIEPKGDVSSDVEKPSMKDSLLSSGSGKDTAPIWGATLQVYNPATQSIQLYRPVTPPPPVEPLRVVSKVKLPLVDREREVKSGSPRSPKRRGKSRKEGRRSAGEARDSGQRTSPRALTSHDTVVEAKQELDRLRRELRKERLMQDMIAEEVDRKWEAADRDTALLGDVLEAQRLLSMPRETRARLLSSRRSLSPRARGVEEGEEDEWDPLTHAVLAGERMVPFGFQQPPPFLQHQQNMSQPAGGQTGAYLQTSAPLARFVPRRSVSPTARSASPRGGRRSPRSTSLVPYASPWASSEQHAQLQQQQSQPQQQRGFNPALYSSQVPTRQNYRWFM